MSQKEAIHSLCPVCGEELKGEDIAACTSCRAPHHLSCWRYNNGCATYGCGSKTFDKTNDSDLLALQSFSVESPPVLASSVLKTAIGCLGGLVGLASYLILYMASLVSFSSPLFPILIFAFVSVAFFLTHFVRQNFTFLAASSAVVSRLTLFGRQLTKAAPLFNVDEIKEVTFVRKKEGEELCLVSLSVSLQSGKSIKIKEGRFAINDGGRSIELMAQRIAKMAGVEVTDEKFEIKKVEEEEQIQIPDEGDFSFKEGYGVALTIIANGAAPLVFGTFVGMTAAYLSGAYIYNWLNVLPAFLLFWFGMFLSSNSRKLIRHQLLFDEKNAQLCRQAMIFSVPFFRKKPWLQLKDVRSVHLNHLEDGRGVAEHLQVQLIDGSWRTIAFSVPSEKANYDITKLAKRLAKEASTFVHFRTDPGVPFADRPPWPVAEEPLGEEFPNPKDGDEEPFHNDLQKKGITIPALCQSCQESMAKKHAVVCQECETASHDTCWQSGGKCPICGALVGCWPTLPANQRQEAFVIQKYLAVGKMWLTLFSSSFVVAMGTVAAAFYTPLLLIPTALFPFLFAVPFTWYRLHRFDPKTKRHTSCLVRGETVGEERSYMDFAIDKTVEVQLEECTHDLGSAYKRIWIVTDDGDRQLVGMFWNVPGGAIEWLAERLARYTETTVRHIREGEIVQPTELKAAAQRKQLEE